jgi:hypothetical protein
MQLHKISRLESSCISPRRSSGMVRRTWLKGLLEALKQILTRCKKVTF